MLPWEREKQVIQFQPSSSFTCGQTFSFHGSLDYTKPFKSEPEKKGPWSQVNVTQKIIDRSVFSEKQFYPKKKLRCPNNSAALELTNSKFHHPRFPATHGYLTIIGAQGVGEFEPCHVFWWRSLKSRSLHSCANGFERRFSHCGVMYTSEKSNSRTKNYYVTSNSRTFVDRTKHCSIWTYFGSGRGVSVLKFKCPEESPRGWEYWGFELISDFWQEHK